MKSIFSIVLMLTLIETCFAQQDSVADVFPLAIGNKWTYRFRIDQYGTMSHYGGTDTGITEYQVIGSFPSSDSIRWQFIERRNFTRNQYGYPYPSVIKDSNTFEIVELFHGRHELYTPTYRPSECYPFQKSYTDSLHFFRYVVVDTNNSATFSVVFPQIGNEPMYYHHTFLLKKKIGVFQTNGDHYDFVARLWTNYCLNAFKSPDTTVSHVVHAEYPNFFSLSQNYPNPFNPTTTISFSIGQSSFVSLKVFDVLGREVLILVSEKLQPGSYMRVFNGIGLPSGVYLYRLESNYFVQTKKILLLK